MPMPNGPANNAPHCPTCGIYLRVHGCTAERCANPERPFAPTGYVSIASTGPDVQAARVFRPALREWEKHVTRAPGVAFCGAALERHDWAFTDAEHALRAVDAARVQPCPACLAVCSEKAPVSPG